MSRTRLAGLVSISMIASGLGWAEGPLQKPQGPIKAAPVIGNICVENIQNLSHQPVNMEGVDAELVAQLQRVGFQANRISAPDGKRCDATVNAELVDISGRGRKNARVDFRLTLAGEEPPRMSSSAHGKSAKSTPTVVSVVSNFRPMEFLPSHGKADKNIAEGEAIFAALADQARQIKIAYECGLPPWLPADK